MWKSEDGKDLGWKVILPGLTLLLFALFGMLVITPLITLTKQEKGQTGAIELSTSVPNAVPTLEPDQAQVREEGRRVLLAAKLQLQRLHPDNRFESFKANYCSGDHAVVTFLIDGAESAAYLVKEDGAWKVVIEGPNPSAAQVKAEGFPANITKYPPPCFVEPRDPELGR